MLSMDHQPDVLVVKYLACNTTNLHLRISKSLDIEVADLKVADVDLISAYDHRPFLYFVSKITVFRSCPIRQFLERSIVCIFFDFNLFSGFTNRTACNRLYSKSADRSDLEP